MNIINTVIMNRISILFFSEFIALANLMNSDEVVVCLKIIIAPRELQINNTFDASNEYWKLKYHCNNGIGKIYLHL